MAKLSPEEVKAHKLKVYCDDLEWKARDPHKRLHYLDRIEAWCEWGSLHPDARDKARAITEIWDIARVR